MLCCGKVNAKALGALVAGIIAGFDWSQRIIVTAPGGVAVFAEGAELLAELRHAVDGPLLATLQTGAGITRIDGNTLQLDIAGEVSRGWLRSSVILDVARTDTPRPSYVGIRITVSVSQAVSRDFLND